MWMMLPTVLKIDMWRELCLLFVHILIQTTTTKRFNLTPSSIIMCCLLTYAWSSGRRHIFTAGNSSRGFEGGPQSSMPNFSAFFILPSINGIGERVVSPLHISDGDIFQMKISFSFCNSPPTQIPN